MQEVAQHCTFQVKTMSFQITKHFFNPHPASIITQGHLSVWHVGGQAPMFVFTCFPVCQQANWVNLLFGSGNLLPAKRFVPASEQKCQSFSSLAAHSATHVCEPSAARRRTIATGPVDARPPSIQTSSHPPGRSQPAWATAYGHKRARAAASQRYCVP